MVLVWERETVWIIACCICIGSAFCVHDDCCVRPMHGDERAFRPFDVEWHVLDVAYFRFASVFVGPVMLR